jgi:hypothetical protein
VPFPLLFIATSPTPIFSPTKKATDPIETTSLTMQSQGIHLAVLAAFACVSLSVVSAQNPCGSTEWRYSPHSKKCYKLTDTKIGWTMGEWKCAFQGGHHPSINTIEENQFVAELAKQAGIIWLGAAQFGGSQDYVWSDGTPFAFEHWKGNQRPRYHKGKKCSKMDGNTGEWLQSCCKVPAAFICEKPALFLPGPIVEDGTGLKEDTAATTNFEARRRMRLRRL